MTDDPKLSEEEADRLAEGMTPFWEAGDDEDTALQPEAKGKGSVPPADPATAFPSSAPPPGEGEADEPKRKKIKAQPVVSAKSIKPDAKKTMVGLAPPPPPDEEDAPAAPADDDAAAKKAAAAEPLPAAPVAAAPEAAAEAGEPAPPQPAAEAPTPAPAPAPEPELKAPVAAAAAVAPSTSPAAMDEPYEPPVRKTNPVIYFAIAGVLLLLIVVGGIKALSGGDDTPKEPASRTESVTATPPADPAPAPKPEATEAPKPEPETTSEPEATAEEPPEPAPVAKPKPVAAAPKPVAKPPAPKPVRKPTPRPAPKPKSGSIVRETPF